MTREAPRTLDQIRRIKDDEQLVSELGAYLTRLGDSARQARGLRDAAIARLADKHGPTETAKRTGVGVNTVKTIRRGARR